MAAVGLAAVWIAAGTLLWRTELPPLDLPELDPRGFFPAAELARIADFRAVTRALWAGSTAVELAVLALLAWQGRSLAAIAGRLTTRRVPQGILLGLAAAVAVWLGQLPLAAVSHWWQRRYGLSEQAYAAWLGDELITLGVTAVLVAIGVGGAVALAARLGRRWWLVGGPALAAIGLLFILLQPLVIQPLFNRFEPLQNRRLAAEIQRIARAEGVHVGEVDVADASRRTTAANAYVAGIGPTKRVVLYDTLLDGRFTHGEIVSVAAHELGHVKRRHLWKGAAWFALLAIPGVWVVARVTERRGGLRHPALVPLGLLVAFAFSLATQPFQNVVSRRYEAEADWLALRATNDPRSAIGLDRELALSSLADPEPPGWAVVWLSTHPSTMKRIAMAVAFARLERP